MPHLTTIGRRLLLPLLASAVLASAMPTGAALGQTVPTRLRGTVATLDGNTLTVTLRDGKSAAVMLRPDAQVATLTPIELSAIRPGAYIATVAEPGPNETWRATAVQVFPEAMRGVGDGHRAWDLTPTSSMTNATVDAAVQGTDGREVTVSYKGGSLKLTVPPGAPVLTIAQASRADLAPGAAVFIFAMRAADGTLSAARVTVSTHGVPLPM